MPTGHRADQPPGWLRVAFEGETDGTTWANVMWWLTVPTTDPTFTQLNALVDAIAGYFGSDLIHTGNCSTETQFTKVVATYAMASAPEKMRTVRVVDVAGAGGTSSEPGQCAWLINWITADGRRGGKPRTYLSGIPDAVMADGAMINPASVTSQTGHANDFHNHTNAITSSPWSELHMIDASFVDGGAYRITPRGFEIFAGVASDVVATQRRRVDRLR